MLFVSPGWFEIQTFILSALTPSEGHRLLRSCIALFIDKSNLFLAATAVRIRYCGSGFSVPTPPVQLALPLAAGQGGVWDQDVLASSAADSRSLPSSPSNAVETQHVDQV